MKRLPMRKIREALRFRAEGFSNRQIAKNLSLGRATIAEYFARTSAAGLGWPLPEDLSDSALERLLFPKPPQRTIKQASKPDWAYVHKELRRQGVTLALLWEEYREVNPTGYCYSHFCQVYAQWRGKLSPVMRQHHPAGERLFVDYAGMTLDVTDPETGEVRAAQLFIASMGASNYTFVEATWTQKLPDWIASHVRAFAYFGGITAQVVPDNLRSAVAKACFYDPKINRSYAELMVHYNTVAIPARPRKPKDKAKVESAVLVAERWILAKLRDRQFFSSTLYKIGSRPSPENTVC